jgi:glycogen synthase
MFGWEFPPFVAGGLGTACHGLVRALLKRGVNITLILPKNITSAREEGLTILGAEYWEFCLNREIKTEEIHNSFKTIRINSVLEPYSGINEPIELNTLSKEAIEKIILEPIADTKSPSKAVYGPNLIEEVTRYNQIAASIANSLEFDIIHCHDWLTFGAGILAKEVSGKPLIVQVHATEFDRSPGSGNSEVKSFEKNGCDRADTVIAVSNLTRDTLVRNYEIPADKIEVVHNGINMTSIPELIVQDKPKLAPKILFLGRVTYQKGPNYFLEAAHKVLQFRPDIEFIIAGAGDMLPYLKGRAVELGISENVSFTGVLNEKEVKEIYQSVDCFVLSSISEPFGLTVLEALSHRLPVIISKQSGVSEVLKNILRYDFWDVERLSALMLSVINYPTLAQELRERGIKDLYPITWDQAAIKVEDIYLNSLQEKAICT